jgi:hypothetical protein
MATTSKIKVMISSRCYDGFPLSKSAGGSNLTDIRRDLKREIQEQELFGKKIFEVWINEDSPPADATTDSWEKCLKEVRDCDILIVLSNGNAGWARDAGSIGICHAEYMEGLAAGRGKVWLIELPATDPPDAKQMVLNAKYKDYLDGQSGFRGDSVKTVADLQARVRQVLNDAIITLTQRGVKSSASSRFDMGQALDWSRMDYSSRKQKMQSVLKASLAARGSIVSDDMVNVSLSKTKTKIGFVVHAIPAAIGISAAKEMIGRPFLKDHLRTAALGKAGGPVHLIACHRTATESQAVSMLGFPDATVVAANFGIYVADDVQKVQFVFLKNCRDESNLIHALQRFFEWLEQTGEVERLAKRALSRRKIIRAISLEL